MVFRTNSKSELSHKLYELKTNKKYKGWVENPDAGHIKDE